jgi:hypothetical protein
MPASVSIGFLARVSEHPCLICFLWSHTDALIYMLQRVCRPIHVHNYACFVVTNAIDPHDNHAPHASASCAARQPAFVQPPTHMLLKPSHSLALLDENMCTWWHAITPCREHAWPSRSDICSESPRSHVHQRTCTLLQPLARTA